LESSTILQAIKTNNMSFFQKLFGSAPAQDLSKLIKEGAMLVDVRSAGEFAEGSCGVAPVGF
jgi:hypothetical protein